MDDLTKVCTIARRQNMPQTQPENSLWTMKQRKARYAIIDQLPLDMKLGVLTKYAEDARWSMCEITCINHSFFLGIGQNYPSEAFVRAFLDELASVGIGHEVMREESLRLCGLETYRTMDEN